MIFQTSLRTKKGMVLFLFLPSLENHTQGVEIQLLEAHTFCHLRKETGGSCRCCIRRGEHGLPGHLQRKAQNLGSLFGKQEFRCEAAVSDRTKQGDPPKFNPERSGQCEERALLESLPCRGGGHELVIRHPGGELAHLAPFLHESPAPSLSFCLPKWGCYFHVCEK